MKTTNTESEKKLWIIRHGYRIDFNDPHWVDTAKNPYNPPLAPVGFEQAAETAEVLKDKEIDFIISSPFLRTIQTANIIAEKLETKVILEAGLSEWNSLKDFDYKPELDDPHLLVKDYPYINPDSESMIYPDYPEDLDALDNRMNTVLAGILAKYGTNILIISHGSPIRSIFKMLIGYQGKDFPSMCSISQFCYSADKWKIEINSDSSHLKNPDTTRKAFYNERWADLKESKKTKAL